MGAWPSISDIAAGVQAGEITASDMAKRAFEKIELSKEFDAIISVTKDRALERAGAIDERVKKGESIGPLAGVPFIAKDNFLTFGGKSTASSNMLKDFEAPYQATAIEKLEEAGAICVAKSNLDAWAHGASTENSDFFVTKNPHDKTRVPGGSSGGSAAAVALGLVPFALGTDTGGSTRQPASFSGCVGYKPTYGLISRSGVVAMASSTDTIGTLAMTVNDAATVIDVLAGRDELDGTTIDSDSEGYHQPSRFELNGVKVGIIEEYMGEELDKGVRDQIEVAAQKLEKAGAQIKKVSLPSMPLSLAVYYIICPAEVSSNLSRYDGQRYGHSADSAKYLDESYFLSREEGFGAEAKRRIMIGAHVLSSGYYDAYYKKAQTVRTKIINELKHAFEGVNFLIGPVSPTTAFKIGEKSGDPLQMYLADLMTVGANIAGNPAISVPAGQTNGLPVGLQIVAPQKGDRQLLAVAKAFEALMS